MKKTPSLLIILAAGIASLLPLTARAADASANGLLVIANKGDRDISLVDPATNQEVARVAEDGVTAHEVIASLDGKRVFAPIYGDSGVGKKGTDGQLIRVIDIASRKIVDTVDFGKGVRPHCPMMNPVDGMLYVTTELDNTVSVIDPATLKIVGTIPTGEPESHMLVLSHDGKRGYTANVASGTVSVLDLTTRKLVKVIPVSKHVQRIAISPDDKFVYTADQTGSKIVGIDTATNEVAKSIALPDIGYGTAITADGKTMVVALINLNEVGFIDLDSMKLTGTVPVPRAPQEVLIRPDQAVAYVSCDASKQVAVINLKERKVATMIAAGKSCDGLAWAPNAK